jgi:hypothetical protein
MENLCIDQFFFDVYDPWSERFQGVHQADSKIFRDFWYLAEQNKPFTKNQASLLCKLIQKYKKDFVTPDVDIDKLIKSFKWRTPFREIDMTKKVYSEVDQDGVIWICLKFPYMLKTKFDESFSENGGTPISFWDDEEKVRKINLYKVNFLQILEFAKAHQLELDDSMLDLAGEIDEIWQNKDLIEKKFTVINNDIKLINVSESAQEFFDLNKSNNHNDNLLLAKELGHINVSPIKSKLFDKICSTDNNLFWINNLEKFLEIHKNTTIKTCVILDRTSEYKKWIENLISLCDSYKIDRADIKVCFREDNKDSEFNRWIKESGLGGKVDSGRIYIFLSTPSKWLYKDIKPYKIILVNSLFPYTNKNTQNLINHHPLVLYAGEAKPSVAKDSKIEEL